MTTTDRTLPYASPYTPKPGWLGRLNFRALIFALVVAGIVGVPFYVWLSDVLSRGVVQLGQYKQVDLKWMSTFDLDQVNGREDDVPKQFRDLDGQKVAAIGEMWAPMDAGNGYLGYCQVVYSRTKCCFNGPPLAQHFVDCNMVRGSKVRYSDGQVRVYGKLHVFLRRDKTGVIKSVYHIDVDHADYLD